MRHRRITLALALAAAAAVAASLPLAASAAGPVIERGRFTDTFADDLFLDLCGIETMTTLTQQWSSKLFADGSEQVHVTRTFVPADRRLPIEKGSGTTFVSPDGVRRVVGKPIQIIRQGGGGVVILDAGQITFGNELTIHGPHPFLSLDPAAYADIYCP